MFRIMVVCTGNICRSPMGEGVLRALLEAEGLGDQIEVTSAGTWASSGMPASTNGVKTAAKQGIDLSGHRSSPLSPDRIRAADLVLTMEPAHRAEVLHVEPTVADRTHVLTLFADPVAGDPAGVEDPIGGDPIAYQATYDEIDGLLRKALPRIVGMVRGR